jgi:hypothetical protein
VTENIVTTKSEDISIGLPVRTIKADAFQHISLIVFSDEIIGIIKEITYIEHEK